MGREEDRPAESTPLHPEERSRGRSNEKLHWPGFVFLVALFGTPLLVRLASGSGTAPSMLLGYAWLAGVVCFAASFRPKRTGWGRPEVELRDLALGAVAGVLLFVLGGVGYAASEAMGLSTATSGAGAPPGAGGAPLLLVAFGVAAVTEELAFRGILQQWLARRMTPALAIPGQALIFAAWHLQVGQLLSALLYGLVLGTLKTRRGSVWPAVIAHLILNTGGAALYLSGQLA